MTKEQTTRMPKNEDGEYELILGNRQLLSGFFLLVVLFGVFFTMGYFVGRHSTPSQINAAAPAVASPVPSSPVETVPAPAPAAPEPGRATVVAAKETPRPASTQPVTPDPPVAQPVTKPAPAAAAAKAPPAVSSPPPKAAAPGGSRVTPAAGDIYLQVSAPAPAAAGSVVDALSKKGISAVIADGPDPSTVRVLVGPLVPADIPAERARLESAGFKPFVRKY
jgi:cytoskeletal protein RodZ